jgi:hypothetical protein
MFCLASVAGAIIAWDRNEMVKARAASIQNLLLAGWDPPKKPFCD